MRYLLFFLVFITISNVQGQIVIKMKSEGGVSTIPCKVNGLALNFIFDTGASDVSMSLTEVSFMLKNGYLKKEDIIGTANYLDANGNVSEGITIVIREIEIAELKLKNIKASVVKNLKAPLLLGQSALRKLGAIQMDFEANTITIDSSKMSVKNVIDSTEKIPEWAEFVSVDTSAIQLTQDEIYYESGIEKFNTQNYHEAIEDFNQAIALNPSKFQYFLQRAIAKDLIQDWKNAILDYEKAIKLNPKSSKAYGFRGETRYRLGDTTGALSDIQLAIQYDPKNAFPYSQRGLIKFDRSKTKEAINDFNIAVKLDPEDYSSYYHRGRAKHKLKNYTAAIADYDTAISLNENNAWYWAKRAEAKFDANDNEAATVDLDKAIELDPELGFSYTLKGLIANKEDDLESAIYYFEKAVELNPNDIYASLQLTFTKNELKERVWISIGNSNDGTEWFMKTETESNYTSTIQLWLKLKHKKYVQKKNGKSITHLNAQSLYLTTVDCASSKLLFEYFIVYDSKGNQIESRQDEYANWQIVPPGSFGEKIVKSVCQRYGK